MKKILPYLLINVAVSAATMLGVILIWNALHPSPIQAGSLEELIAPPVKNAGQPLPPLDEPLLEIQSVFLPGDKDYEKISLKNISTEPVDLSGWSLVNQTQEIFTFPSLTLYPNGALEVWTKAGVNTAVELFWNAPEALWKSGEYALLLDSAGQERTRYLIP